MSSSNSYIIYEGASLLDSAPIVVIATGFDSASENDKTGDMIQTFIIRSDVEPTIAAQTGQDASVCGDCKHRGTIEDGKNVGRTCYVNIGQSVLAVYRAYKRGSYSHWDSSTHSTRGRFVRLGTYGDPMAVPIGVWHEFLLDADGHTGYTHQWANPNIDGTRYRGLCMASVDTPDEAALARRAGWRYFRVALPSHASKQKGETLCPASAEAGRALTCDKCRACDGLGRGLTKSIFIPAHGNSAVMANIRRRDAAVAA